MLVALVAIVMCLFFLTVGVYKARASQSNDSFFFMDRSANSGDYVTTTVAYSLQVAVTVYFIYWGFTYGWSNIFFILTWLFGMFLFSIFSPKIASFLKIHTTLFDVLFSKKKWFRLISAAMVSLSLCGLIYSEIYFSSAFIANAIVASVPDAAYGNTYWLVAIILLLVTVWYGAVGGMHKIVLTDKIQLGLAYLSSSIVLAVLLLDASENSPNSAGLLSIFSATTYFCICVSPFLIRVFFPSKNIKPLISIPMFPTISALTSSLICLIPLALTIDSSSSQDAIVIPGIFSMVSEPVGWWPIVGFGLANLIWQFSDYTAYHRLSILTRYKGDEEEIALVRSSILSAAVSSPLTWFIGVAVGMAIRIAGDVEPGEVDVFGAFVQWLNLIVSEGSFLGILALVALSVFMISVLLSTMDSAFVAIGQMIIIDILKVTQIYFRYIALLLIVLGISIVAAMQVFLSIDAFVLLGVVYSWSLVLGPPVIARFSGLRIGESWLLAAPIAGAVVGSVNSFNPLELPYLASLVFPAIAAISTSAIVVLIGGSVSRRGKQPMDDDKIRTSAESA